MLHGPEMNIVMLVLGNDRCPVEEWLDRIRDKTTRARIERQIDKLSRGLGVQKGLGGIAELKIDIGPGYWVYYASLDARTMLVLLGGGDKSTQSKDIAAARSLWDEFQQSQTPEAALRAWRQAQDGPDETSPEEEGIP